MPAEYFHLVILVKDGIDNDHATQLLINLFLKCQQQLSTE